MPITLKNEARVIRGHVLDVGKTNLERALRRYDPFLYVKWNPKKDKGRGIWELRRRPEFKSIKEPRVIDTPKGPVGIPGDIYDCGDFNILVLNYNENSFENHVKDFDYLTYDMVAWVAKHDLWNYGFKGKNVVREADYNEAKYLDKIDEDSHNERQYMIKQHRTEFQDYAAYINSGGNPARLVDFWGK